MAVELGAARRSPLDLHDQDDQTLLASELRARIRRLSRSRQITASIDQPRREPNAETDTWHRILAAPESSNPLNILIQADMEEPEMDWLEVAALSYSEVSAYILLLVRFSWDRKELAAFLAISVFALLVRLTRAVDVSRRQPSLFDGIEVIDPNFEARNQRHVTRRQWPEVDSQLLLT